MHPGSKDITGALTNLVYTQGMSGGYGTSVELERTATTNDCYGEPV